jgi:hypothetical protein
MIEIMELLDKDLPKLILILQDIEENINMMVSKRF